MGARGRKSANAIETVAVSLNLRPDPPEKLTRAGRQMWRDIVAKMPVDWFPLESHPLLVAYIRQALLADIYAKKLESLTVEGDLPLALIEMVEKLSAMQTRAENACAGMATKLRLTPQSRYTPQAAATGTKKSSGEALKPWEFGKSAAAPSN